MVTEEETKKQDVCGNVSFCLCYMSFKGDMKCESFLNESVFFEMLGDFNYVLKSIEIKLIFVITFWEIFSCTLWHNFVYADLIKMSYLFWEVKSKRKLAVESS